MPKTYDASNIKVLEGLAPVRNNPSMYLGDSGPRGLHHAVWELVDNAVDEHLAGFCDKISVVIHADGMVSVEDNGRGIPIDIHPEKKRPAVEVIMTTLFSGAKWTQQTYSVAGGLHGLGVSIVNALSEHLHVIVWREGFEWSQSYERGVPTSDLQKGKKIPKNKTGTKVQFKPDAQIFQQTTEFNADTICRRLTEISFLEPGLTINLVIEKTGEHTILKHDGGLVEYIKYLNEEKDPCFPQQPVLWEEESAEDKMSLSIAWQYCDQIGDETLSFTNIIPTPEGGTHVSGFRGGMTRALNTWARSKGLIKEKDKNLDGADVRDGLTVALSLKISGHIQFEGQTKGRLGNPEAESFVSQVVQEKFTQYLDDNERVGKRIVETAQLSRKAREEARAVADRIKRKGPLGSHRLPGKLADCSIRDPERCELFIVEGKSAAGPAKEARDTQTQAVFPIRGKLRNVEKASLADALRNEEIQSLITCLGTGFIGASGNDEEEEESDSGFSVEKLRYHKIIILTDADSDGKHIQTLLLTFFFRFMRPLIEAGHIYVADPPLYRLEVGVNSHYAWNDAELKALQEKHKSGSVQRFKGLGEMTSDGLGMTSIHPETRRVNRIEVESMGEADRLVGHLMGNAVEPRKVFLEDHTAEYYEKVFQIVM